MPSYKDIYRNTITDKKAILTFGKYKGQSIEFVMDTDPQYLLFCQSSIDWFDLDHKILDELDRTEDERLRDSYCGLEESHHGWV